MKKKITKQFLSDKYDELYKRADAIHKKYNPCQVKKRKDDLTCVAGRDGHSYCTNDLHESFSCCANCRYLGEAGCSVEAIRCKFWFCGYLYEHDLLDPEAKKELEAIVNECWEYGFFVFRGNKEDNLYEAYYKFGLLRTLRL
ncbi:MAG: hypothetical protein ABH859_00275 [Pseudomonadota bacterium]